MDFGREYLIFVKGSEETDNIAELGLIGASINIKYKQKDLIYSHDTNSATVLSDPDVIDLSAGAVLYYNNVPLLGVNEAYRFPGFYSVYFDDGARRTYPEASVTVEANVLKEGFKEANDPLREMYEELGYVRPGSVLHQYMKGESFARDEANDDPVVYPLDSNLSQRQAIKNVLSNSVSIIDGPPGTGKTKTVINLILNIAAVRNQTVAVVSRDESAANSIFEILSGEGYGFLLARPYGDGLNVYDQRQLDELKQADAAGYQAVAAENQKLETLLELERKKNKLREKLSLWQLELNHFEKAKKDITAKKIKKLPWVKWDTAKILKLWAELEMCTSENREDGFWTTPGYYLKYGISDWEEILSSYDESIRSLQHLYIEGRIKELKKELAGHTAGLESGGIEKSLEHQKKISGSYVKNSLYERYSGKAYGFTGEKYKEDFDEFVMFLELFPVVITTIDSLKKSIRQNYVYDYLIIEEAAEIDLQSGLPALSCGRNAVFIGDSRQQSPNLMSAVTEVFGETAPSVFLREQYLCHPDIVRFFNEQYFNGDLIACKETETDDEDSSYYKEQAYNFSSVLKTPSEKPDDLARHIEYILTDDSLYEKGGAPVSDLLYRRYNSVLVSLQDRFLKRSKYKTNLLIIKTLDEILEDPKYRHLRYRYNVRLSDIIMGGDVKPDDEKFIKGAVIDFTVFSVYGKKPELTIGTGESDRRKDALLKSLGIHTVRLQADTENPEKLIIHNIEKIFGA